MSELVNNEKNSNDNIDLDPRCNPEKPVKIKFEEISMADYKIRDVLFKTPCEKSKLSKSLEMDIYFKKENMFTTGSFKERGARNALLCLTKDEKKKGVITASAGNHSLALSYHGKLLNIKITVIMPITSSLMKQRCCSELGSKVILKGNDLNESKKIALKMSKEKNLTYINGYDHPDVIAGQGTMGLQIAEQVKDVEAVIIPVGGGGLLAGTALALKTLNPNIVVYGVESEKCPSFSNSMKNGKPTYTEPHPSLADGLSVPMIGVNAFHTAKSYVDRIVVVEEDFIALAILRLIETEKLIVEGSGAAGLAAIIAGKVPELKNKIIVIPLCGGNIDTAVLGRVIDRGLAIDGRLIRFVVVIPDVPGSISVLTNIMKEQGVSIKDILHERAWLTSDVFSVQVKCVCETKDEKHAEIFKKVLLDKFERVSWGPRMI